MPAKTIPLPQNIDPSQLPIIRCTCGSTRFHAELELRKVSALQSPLGQEMILEARFRTCKSCGTYLPQDRPKTELENKPPQDIPKKLKK